MKDRIARTHLFKTALFLFVFGLSGLLLAACGDMDPRNVDVELKQSAPAAKTTSYTSALQQLGLMTEIYDTGSFKIQSNPIGDVTGTSGSTGGEIPRDITEMVKSSLNSVGGNIVYIPYDPSFIQNQMVTGYSNFDTKTIPDVVLTGGITEFDRGLETRGDGTNFGAEANFTGAPKWLPSKTVGIDYGDKGKEGLARITLDFNLINFQTMTGIARMNTVNSLEVHKALHEKELGITLFGPTFGLKGSIKKVEGRHAAVRLLVELSMIQIIGKHLVLPYWRLLGDDAQPDQVVVQQLERSFYQMDETQRIISVQEWLFLYGSNVDITGTMDEQTRFALQQHDSSFAPGAALTLDLFKKLYLNLPLDQKTFSRRTMLTKLYQQVAAAPAAAPPQQQAAPQQQQPPVLQQAAAPAPGQQPQAAPPQPARNTPAPQPEAPAPARKKSIGRILSDSDW